MKNTKPITAYTFEFTQTFAATATENFVEFIPPSNVVYTPLWDFNNTTNTSGPFIITGFVSADKALPASNEYRTILKLSGVSNTFKFASNAIFKDENTSNMNVYSFLPLSGNRLLSIKKKRFSSVQSNNYLGDVNRDGTVDIGDAAWIASYAAQLPGFQQENTIYGDVNKDGTVDIGDAAYIASYAAQLPGFELPFITNPTATPTPTAFSGVIEIDENWKLVAYEGDTLEESTLDFMYQNEVMARIIPHESGDVSDKITPQSVEFNETSILSESGTWTIMYPSPDMARSQNKYDEFKNLGVDSIEKQLKFLYNGYPQTLIMPMINSEGKLLNGGVDFGKLWKLIGEAQQVVFYYRDVDIKEDGTDEIYFPQVLIGTSGLRRYLTHAQDAQTI
jgi:hypothetical protein